MEIVKCRVLCFDNIIQIIPEDGVKDNSLYEIRLKNVKSTSGVEINENFKVYTKLSPVFVDVESVKSIIYGLDIPDDVILYNIREASRFAEYIKEEQIDENNVPFEVSQFVRYKAAYECLLRHGVSSTVSTGLSGTVGNVSFSEKETNRDISKLLGTLRDEVAKWLDEVKGYKLEGRARIKSAVRGSNSLGAIKGLSNPTYYNKTPLGVDREV